MKIREALAVAARLEALGVTVRSAELREQAERHREFAENGNRKLRRAALQAVASTSTVKATSSKAKRRRAGKAARAARRRNRA